MSKMCGYMIGFLIRYSVTKQNSIVLYFNKDRYSEKHIFLCIKSIHIKRFMFKHIIII